VHPAAPEPGDVLPAVAVDGKSVAGTFSRAGGGGVHLMAAFRHEDGVVAGQRRVPAGGEPAGFAPLPDTVDPAGTVVTADALHTQRDHARYLHDRGAHYVFTVKTGWPRVYTQLDSLPWQEIPALILPERGHGRTELRTIQVAPLGLHGFGGVDSPTPPPRSRSSATGPATPPAHQRPTPRRPHQHRQGVADHGTQPPTTTPTTRDPRLNSTNDFAGTLPAQGPPVLDPATTHRQNRPADRGLWTTPAQR
jgi:hypothetical protein